ncbi:MULTISPECIES: hypothetical protein [unclassified Sphingobacterium]|uniref:hypothetical protein n=1 Tax=unclassified Sphingobacterium TaxID=2609468 RepID=UPI0025E8F46D|nr:MULTISPECIES: hypothetical protein [unclassified Sphingobacterium]
MKQTIIDAIKGQNLLEFSYNGHQRVVEPHTFGVSTKRNDSLSAYKVGGTSDKGVVPDWKLFTISKIVNLEKSDETFTGTRSGYTKNDSRMSKIYAEL